MIRPFDSDFQNLVEIFNEATVLITIDITFLFNQSVDDEEAKIYAGWMLISIVLLNFFTNFLVILKETIKQLIRYIAYIRMRIRIKRGVRNQMLQVTKMFKFNRISFEPYDGFDTPRALPNGNQLETIQEESLHWDRDVQVIQFEDDTQRQTHATEFKTTNTLFSKRSLGIKTYSENNFELLLKQKSINTTFDSPQKQLKSRSQSTALDSDQKELIRKKMDDTEH
ncbi:UNKNOWN [Stylonychia lemnae]|uniref:Uncharacterized protein n=1 Tax=Stylonychia lemnae TaxID=5949 RepID=A0A078A1E1_STYLE|nr:UNKNOWN [Stylonychia lemnae]|eukprot:CDW76071.1 UNKNOWN [Stylonychia lemnae]